MAPAAKKKATKDLQSITLGYQLADLPSSQHRSGLAGLILMIEFLHRQPGHHRGTARVAKLHARGADIELDAAGLTDLFDVAYQTTLGERAEPRLRKDKAKQDVEPLRTEEVPELDKNGKEKLVTKYYYPEYVPAGAFLLERDPGAAGGKGPWIKLWRDMIWAIPRGVPATRKPFEDRAEGAKTSDASDTWKDLVKEASGQHSVELSSALFLGAQECTAEGVSFLDRAAQKLLLHFSLFVAQVYVPQVVDSDGKNEFVGYAVVFPDISNLEVFCDELPRWLLEREPEVRGYRPRAAIVDLPEIGALEIQAGLAKRLQQRLQSPSLADLLLGFDVLHLAKEGNNIRLKSWNRVAVQPQEVFDELRTLKELWSALFRRQRMINLLYDRPRWHGFDRLISTTRIELTFDESTFRHDARAFFEIYSQEKTVSDDDDNEAGEGKELPALVFRAARNYVNRRVEQKHRLSWDKAKGDPQAIKDLNERREAIARSAFLAARSRNGADFIEFFAGTICSVPQRSKGGEEAFAILSQALIRDTDTVRTLTLLALSANA
jgi:CRISPR-associated protein Cmx8